MTDAEQNRCVTPGCAFTTPTAWSPFCGACLKMHAVEGARRAGEAVRGKIHGVVDRGFGALLDGLARRFLSGPPPT